MRLLPLLLHAAARLPALTDIFSDRLAVTSMVVTAGGKVVITTAQSHGVTTGERTALSVVDADTPNPITGAAVVPDGIRITLAHEHDLTQPWNLVAKLSGFTDARLNGNLQLTAVDSPSSFIVTPPAHIASVTLNGSEKLLERMEAGIIGWHAATATGASTLEFDTPDQVTRSYTVAAPVIAVNQRIAGSLSLQVAQRQYVRGYAKSATEQTDGELGKAWLFICPWQSMRLSKDRNSNSDAQIERTANSEDRRMLVDGYYVYVALPAENSGGGVACSDLANGPILAAILRTFDGLSLPRREFFQGDTFVHSMIEHGQALGDYDGATYWHGYSFEAPTFLTQWDSIRPFEWSRISETGMAVASGLGPGSTGGTVIEAPIITEGSVRFRSINFGTADEGYGIRHDDAPQPLTVKIMLD